MILSELGVESCPPADLNLPSIREPLSAGESPESKITGDITATRRDLLAELKEMSRNPEARAAVPSMTKNAPSFISKYLRQSFPSPAAAVEYLQMIINRPENAPELCESACVELWEDPMAAPFCTNTEKQCSIFSMDMLASYTRDKNVVPLGAIKDDLLNWQQELTRRCAAQERAEMERSARAQAQQEQYAVMWPSVSAAREESINRQEFEQQGREIREQLKEMGKSPKSDSDLSDQALRAISFYGDSFADPFNNPAAFARECDIGCNRLEANGAELSICKMNACSSQAAMNNIGNHVYFTYDPHSRSEGKRAVCRESSRRHKDACEFY
jgi:hypothetical protein